MDADNPVPSHDITSSNNEVLISTFKMDVKGGGGTDSNMRDNREDDLKFDLKVLSSLEHFIGISPRWSWNRSGLLIRKEN